MKPRQCLWCQCIFLPTYQKHIVCNGICWGGAKRYFERANPTQPSWQPEPVVEWLKTQRWPQPGERHEPVH